MDILEQKRNDRLQTSKQSGIKKKLNIVAGKSISEEAMLTLKHCYTKLNWKKRKKCTGNNNGCVNIYDENSDDVEDFADLLQRECEDEVKDKKIEADSINES